MVMSLRHVKVIIWGFRFDKTGFWRPIEGEEG
jgi:hypothetical protein